MGKFIVRTGELKGRKFRLEEGARVVLGREIGDINFPDKRMSRRHCVIESREDGDHLDDLGATNGTWLNNARIQQSLLKPGDVIRMGYTEIEFLGTPEHSTALALGPEGEAGGNKTIAIRAEDLRAAASGVVGAKEKLRMRAAKSAAMGQGLAVPEQRLISAKGKFCEACGEAIFMREGAPDEGRAIGGLYLCRMCAMIAEKQKVLGEDYMPSYAKIVGGRMPVGAGPEGLPEAPPDAGQPQMVPPPAPPDVVEVVEVDEVDLEELTGVAMPAVAPAQASTKTETAARVPTDVPAEAQEEGDRDRQDDEDKGHEKEEGQEKQTEPQDAPHAQQAVAEGEPSPSSDVDESVDQTKGAPPGGVQTGDG